MKWRSHFCIQKLPRVFTQNLPQCRDYTAKLVFHRVVALALHLPQIPGKGNKNPAQNRNKEKCLQNKMMCTSMCSITKGKKLDMKKCTHRLAPFLPILRVIFQREMECYQNSRLRKYRKEQYRSEILHNELTRSKKQIGSNRIILRIQTKTNPSHFMNESETN